MRCSPLGHKESDTTEQLNSNNVKDCKEAKGRQRQQRPLVGPEGCTAAQPFPDAPGWTPFPDAPGWTPFLGHWGGPPSRAPGWTPFLDTGVDPFPDAPGWTPFPDAPG